MEVLATGLHELYGIAIGAGGGGLVAEGSEGRVLEVASGEVKVKARLARPTAIAASGVCTWRKATRAAPCSSTGAAHRQRSLTASRSHRDWRSAAILCTLLTRARELIAASLNTEQRETVASNLPVGAAPAVVRKLLLGIPRLLPGPLRPFAGVSVANNGKIYLAADGEGQRHRVEQTVRASGIYAAPMLI